MTRAHYKNSYEQAIGGGVVTVCNQAVVSLFQPGTSSPVTWPIYAAASGAGVQTQPLTADATGTIEFWTDTAQRFDASVKPLTSGPFTVTADATSPDALASLVITTGGLTVTGGIVSSNALTVTSGGASITGGVTIPSGGLNVQGGGITVVGGETISTGDVSLGAVTSKLGFYGHATVTQAVLATGAGHTADDIITALQNLGLVKQA